MILQIFDFDDTLINTPPKPRTNREAHKVGWNGKDWWGSTCSLENISPKEKIFQFFLQARNDPNTIAVLLTGRRNVIAWRVRQILREYGAPGRRIIPVSNSRSIELFADKQNDEDSALHDEYFTGDFSTEPDYPTKQKLGNTLTHKIFIIEHRLINSDVAEIHLWDDRKEHLQPLLDLLQRLLQTYPNLKCAVMHQVDSDVVIEHIIHL